VVFLNESIFKLISEVNSIMELQPNLHYSVFKRYSKAFNLQVLYLVYQLLMFFL